MTTYFEARDGYGEPTIWAPGHTPIGDVPVLRKRDVPTELWPEVVARMTGTTEAALQSVIDRLSKESDSWHAIAMANGAELAQVKAELTVRMTGTTITAPDKDALSALCLSFLKPPKYAGGSWTLNPDDLADAVLAALTGVPHD